MKFSICVAALLFSFVSVQPIEAQIVQFGPGGSVNVRAPFVRVYVGPNGETHVRAPFTEVTSPGYGYPVPQSYIVPQPQFSNPRKIEPIVSVDPEQVAEMNWEQLRQFLRTSALQLDQDLEGEQAIWKRAFLPGTIRDLVSEDNNAPLDLEAVERLRPILAAFEEFAADESLSEITNLVSFQDVQQSLAELLAPPHARLRRLLVASSKQLNEDLNRVGNVESLKTYLSLPEALGEDSPDRQPTADQFDKAISNYEALNRTSQYRAIAQLRSFQKTRQWLADYQRLLLTDQVEVAPVEELELPSPKK